MAEVGCLKGGHFQNLQVEGTTVFNGATHFKIPVEILTAARVITAADSGTTFILGAAGGAAITLPSVANAGDGFNCKFIVGTAFETSSWTITATAAIMVGGINELDVDTGDNGPSTVAGTILTLAASGETIGDYVDIICAGTKMFISGQSKGDGFMSFNA